MQQPLQIFCVVWVGKFQTPLAPDNPSENPCVQRPTWGDRPVTFVCCFMALWSLSVVWLCFFSVCRCTFLLCLGELVFSSTVHPHTFQEIAGVEFVKWWRHYRKSFLCWPKQPNVCAVCGKEDMISRIENSHFICVNLLEMTWCWSVPKTCIRAKIWLLFIFVAFLSYQHFR